MATWLRDKISGWVGRADNSPGLPTQVPSAPPQPVGPPVVVVVTSPPSAAPHDATPASVIIEIGTANLHQPPSPAPKLQGRAAIGPVLPTYHTGEAPVLGSPPVGSPATHRALRTSDAQRISKAHSEQECLARLQELEKDRPSGLRDAERAYYKILLAKKAADPIQAKSRLIEAREYLDSAQRITQGNTFCPPPVLENWSQKIKENQTFLNQVAAELSISLDPEPSPMSPAPALTPPSRAPEKPSSSHSSITYIVVGIIALLGVFLVTRGAIYGSRLWPKI